MLRTESPHITLTPSFPITPALARRKPRLGWRRPNSTATQHGRAASELTLFVFLCSPHHSTAPRRTAAPLGTGDAQTANSNRMWPPTLEQFYSHAYGRWGSGPAVGAGPGSRC